VTCDRCGHDAGTSSVSYFNTDTCCMECIADEQQAPGFAAARAAELAAVQGGDVNFVGVGLSPADVAFLAERRAAR